ncbi:hypothetical protein CEXT_137351 [Caerostris extrusa]|uniref:Uncharacterized protein n=1 Tax=Caerostris extrusa TaxID=172846 RepID=A0AAV4WGE5_CAEEX|nr:hypothetical protein CEXT_137351 [Caerostris extrusa]
MAFICLHRSSQTCGLRIFLKAFGLRRSLEVAAFLGLHRSSSFLNLHRSMVFIDSCLRRPVGEQDIGHYRRYRGTWVKENLYDRESMTSNGNM